MRESICPNCGTENEEQYSYCKNCGTSLITEQPEKASAPQTDNTPPISETPESGTYNTYGNAQDAYTGCINEISQEEMYLFVGKKAHNIVPKFIRMEYTNSKVCWCWPAAILSFFFGPIGLSIWYFYRKMYKPAWLLTIAAVIYSILTAITSLYTLDFSSYFESIANGDAADFYPFLQDHLFLGIIGLITSAITIACIVLGGLFSYYLYKKHCINKIREFKSMHANTGFYKFGLAATGGTSGGMLAVGIVLAVVIDSIANFIIEVIRYLF